MVNVLSLCVQGKQYSHCQPFSGLKDVKSIFHCGFSEDWREESKVPSTSLHRNSKNMSMSSQ